MTGDLTIPLSVLIGVWTIVGIFACCALAVYATGGRARRPQVNLDLPRREPSFDWGLSQAKAWNEGFAAGCHATANPDAATKPVNPYGRGPGNE